MDSRELLVRYIRDSSNEDMHIYGAGFLAHLERGIWALDHLMDLARARNARVLDVGCGYGWHALYMAHAGENDVVALDYRPLMTETVNKRVAELSSAAGPLSMRAVAADICADERPPELGPAKFDAVICLQALEHIRDLPKCFRVVHELLAPGGTFFATNGNNVLNPRVVAESREMWHKRDRSPEFIATLRKERPIENADAEPYAAMRERIVRDANPNLSESEVAQLVAATAGMIAVEIAELARDFRAGRALPSPPELSWCRNPLTGEYCERLLDPFELRQELIRAGFRNCQVRHTFRRLPLRLLNATGLRALDRALFARKAEFALLGTKA